MATISLSRDHMLDVLDDAERIVRDEITGERRWSVTHELIFKHEGKLYRTHYSVGATEQQYETPWQYTPEVVCTEVEPFERTIVDFRAVKD